MISNVYEGDIINIVTGLNTPIKDKAMTHNIVATLEHLYNIYVAESPNSISSVVSTVPRAALS